MATHRIPILGTGTVPDTSGDVFQEPYTIKATNDVWGRLVWIFNDTEGAGSPTDGIRIGLEGGFTVGRCYFQVLTECGLDHWGRYLDEYRPSRGTWLFETRAIRIDGRVPGGWSDRVEARLAE